MLLNEKSKLVDDIRNMRNEGNTLANIHTDIDTKISIESIRRFTSDDNKVVSTKCDNYINLADFTNMVSQIDDKIIMPIVELTDIPIEDVYDFTTKSDNHDFYANGILVRNCPCETPEGHGVGVIKNMASTAGISIFSSPITVYAFIQKS
jgi:hypothetical protein